MLSRTFITLCLVLALFAPYFALPKTAHAFVGCVSALLGSLGGATGGGGEAETDTGDGGSLSQEATSELSGDKVPTVDSKQIDEQQKLNKKEQCIDGLLTAAAKIAIKSVTSSIINWINSGFEGDPTFLGNPGAFFADIANEVSGLFIQDLGLAGLCDPFRPQILIALAQAREQPRFKCTLLDVVDNFENFQNDFSQGGWPAWIQMTQYPQNNPYGLYAITLDTQNRLINNALSLKQDELAQGKGFLSIRSCASWDPQYEYAEDKSTYTGAAKDGGIKGCEFAEVTTPGDVISSQLNHALGSPLRQAELADEISESLTTIFNTLINKLISDGVRSLTSKSTGKSVLDTSTNDIKTLIALLESGATNLQKVIDFLDQSILLIADISKKIDGLVTECDAYLKSKYPPGDPLYPGTLRSRQSGLGTVTAAYSRDVENAAKTLSSVAILLTDAQTYKKNQDEGTATTQEYSDLLARYTSLVISIPDNATTKIVEEKFYQYQTDLATLDTTYAECKGTATATTTASIVGKRTLAIGIRNW